MTSLNCQLLIQFLASDGHAHAGLLANCQRSIVAESLIRSFEVKRKLVVEFRKSKSGINWVANSEKEIDINLYLEAVDALNVWAIEGQDVRFVNTALKMIDAKCGEQGKPKRNESIAVIEQVLHA